MKIRCRTSFDITATGVTGHYKPSRVPFYDQAGNRVVDETSWIQSRNQQRNWETLTQLISLRTQISDLSQPSKQNQHWIFDFEVENNSLFAKGEDPLGVLKEDCANVPVIDFTTSSVLPVITPGENIWFEIVDK